MVDGARTPYRDIDGGALFDSRGLPVAPRVECLRGPNGLPLRLYGPDGRPVTDRKGRVLKTINDKPLLTADEDGRLRTDNLSIRDKNRNEVDDPSFDGTVASDIVADKLLSSDGKPLILYDESGRPLTDVDGHVLRDIDDRPLAVCHPSKPITTSDGRAAFDVNGSQCRRGDVPGVEKPTVYYDKSGRPLTDQFGQVLLTKTGVKLMQRRRRKWTLCRGDGKAVGVRLLRESHAVSPGVQLFDVDNVPLTDASGDMLYNLSGAALLRVGDCGEILSDFLGRPVFDVNGLPVSKLSGRWTDRKTRPLRLFNVRGLPLTDRDGSVLHDIDGRQLVLDDRSGRPLFDMDYQPVRDARGKCVFSPHFKPLIKSERSAPKLLDSDGSGLRVFNGAGWPLTSPTGHVLVDAAGRKLVKLKNGSLADRDGKTVYDADRRPYGCSARRPMVGMDSKPYWLYSSDGKPLTSDDGAPLVRDGTCAVVFDVHGRPVDAVGGGGVFDSAALRIDERMRH